MKAPCKLVPAESIDSQLWQEYWTYMLHMNRGKYRLQGHTVEACMAEYTPLLPWSCAAVAKNMILGECTLIFVAPHIAQIHASFAPKLAPNITSRIAKEALAFIARAYDISYVVAWIPKAWQRQLSSLARAAQFNKVYTCDSSILYMCEVTHG
jgi:hypothetical protein